MYDKQHLPITALCLNVTDSCNFNCRYCFVKQKPNHMPFQIANDSIQWLLNNKKIYESIFQEEKNVSVLFFGGEPLLEWDSIIFPIVTKYPNIDYSITTNGFLLNEEKINFLARNNISVMLSMDGNKTTQNYNRQDNSFQMLDNIIPYFLSQIKYNMFRGTIIPQTCQHTFNNICYAASKGFKRCYFTIDIFSSWNEKQIDILEQEIKKFTLLYINSFVNKTQIIDFTPFTEMIKLIIKKECALLDKNEISIYKCGLGNGYGAVDYKGDIYSCQEVVTDNIHNQMFKIGNIYSGIDFKSLKQLQTLIINDLPITNTANNCENCPLIFTCKQTMCQVNNYICNNNCLIQSYNQCWWNLLLYKNASLAISMLQNLPDFQDYMFNIVLKEGGVKL